MKVRTTLAMALAGVWLATPLTAQNVPPADNSPDTAFVLPDAAALADFNPNLRKATAIVNGAVITDTDVEQRLNLVVAANGGKIDAEEKVRLRLQVLRNLIDEKLEIQEAASKDIKLSGAEIDSAYNRVAANFKNANGTFVDFLREAGSSPQSIRGQIQGELAWSKLLRRTVEPQVNVGDDEVKAVIAKLTAAKGKDEYHVGEIFLSATPETEARVLTDANRIVGQIRGGASFVAYARQFSEASTAGLGGDLGWVRAEQLNDAVAPTVIKLTAGDAVAGISDPIRVPQGVAIMALLAKRQVLSGNPDDAILSLKQLSLPLRPSITQAEGEAVVAKFKAATQEMGGCGRAEAVAKDLGAEIAINDAIAIKDLPTALQNLMKQLSIGQATPPFGSAADGLRVLVLCGRDDRPVKVAEPSFDAVYSQMNEERVNMRARRYLRDLRRDAIVDYR
ncbi:MAG: SurA N-terminal domain-containing protein [Sphingomonadaceae bacterium]|nr:SurA N-terminal domain-containing protein [Sphingomonadaceae bacterium]